MVIMVPDRDKDLSRKGAKKDGKKWQGSLFESNNAR